MCLPAELPWLPATRSSIGWPLRRCDASLPRRSTATLLGCRASRLPHCSAAVTLDRRIARLPPFWAAALLGRRAEWLSRRSHAVLLDRPVARLPHCPAVAPLGRLDKIYRLSFEDSPCGQAVSRSIFVAQFGRGGHSRAIRHRGLSSLPGIGNGAVEPELKCLCHKSL